MELASAGEYGQMWQSEGPVFMGRTLHKRNENIRVKQSTVQTLAGLSVPGMLPRSQSGFQDMRGLDCFVSGGIAIAQEAADLSHPCSPPKFKEKGPAVSRIFPKFSW